MRRAFGDVIKTNPIDINVEYKKVYIIFTKMYLPDIEEHFLKMPFKGTCLTFDEFNEKYEFNFEENPVEVTLDYFINFCEYFYNLLWALMVHCRFNTEVAPDFAMSFIEKIIDEINYGIIQEQNVVWFVEKNEVVRAVEERVTHSLKTKVVKYNHHSMKGDLEQKKLILKELADDLEGKKTKLKEINSSLEKDIFFAFNNLNIRHNNVSEGDNKNYKKYIAEMPLEELEEWYDETYQMYLIAILELEQSERKKRFDQLRELIETFKKVM